MWGRESSEWDQNAVDNLLLLAFVIIPLQASDMYVSSECGDKSFIFREPRLTLNKTKPKATVDDWINMRCSFDVVYLWVHRTALVQINSIRIYYRSSQTSDLMKNIYHIRRGGHWVDNVCVWGKSCTDMICLSKPIGPHTPARNKVKEMMWL